MAHGTAVATMTNFEKPMLYDTACEALGAEPTMAWFVPGRIEFLGKHTDYAGGRQFAVRGRSGFCDGRSSAHRSTHHHQARRRAGN